MGEVHTQQTARPSTQFNNGKEGMFRNTTNQLASSTLLMYMIHVTLDDALVAFSIAMATSSEMVLGEATTN